MPIVIQADRDHLFSTIIAFLVAGSLPAGWFVFCVAYGVRLGWRLAGG